jgi:adenylate kinase
MALNLIMLGPPGAGKGTQAERLARGRRLPKISTGDILREAVEARTEIGRRVEAVMKRGDLVSDEVVTAIVRERLNKPDARGGFILDGFPRTVWQARALDEIMGGRDPLVIIHFSVPEAEIVRRLGTRLVCGTCGTNAPGPATDSAGDAQRCRRCGGALVQRADDQQVVVLERLKVYHRQTEPLIEYYSGRPTFREVNGARPLEQVTADLVDVVDQAYRLATSTAGGVR